MAKTKTYEMTWRNKWITSNAKSIDDMITSLESNVSELRRMKEDGLEGEFDGAGDDYISFTTSDAELAKKYHMNEMDFGYDCDDEDCENCLEENELDDFQLDSSESPSSNSIVAADWGVAKNSDKTLIT